MISRKKLKAIKRRKDYLSKKHHKDRNKPKISKISILFAGDGILPASKKYKNNEEN